jgi:hypothetical protein
MVLVLTVMAGGAQRCILVDEVVGVAQTPPPPPSLSPRTRPTYLPCVREKRAQSGEMTVSNSVVSGGGRNRGAVSARGDKILPPSFLPARGSSRHLHGHSRSCRCSALLAHGGQRRGWLWGNDRFERILRAGTKDTLTHMQATTQPRPNNPINAISALQDLVCLHAATNYALEVAILRMPS